MLTIEEFLERWRAHHRAELSRQRLMAYIKSGTIEGAQQVKPPEGSRSRMPRWEIPEERVTDWKPRSRGRPSKQNEGA